MRIDRLDLLGRTQVFVQGFWEPVSKSQDKQSSNVIAVKIECDSEEKVCREADASMLLGVLGVDLGTYEVASWTKGGIVAEDGDSCNRHTLTIDLKSNSVMVADYSVKPTARDSVCTPLPHANSYALHGGELQLYPPPS